jgi:hypothetical protein
MEGERMATSTETGPVFTASQREELLRLLEDADSAELKLTVSESEQPAAAASLGMDPIDARIRQVFFFDTPDLALNGQGVVVRARRIQGKGDDSVVKLRPVVPAELPAKLRRLREFVVEVDAIPGGFVCSGSLKRALPKPYVRDAVAGRVPLRKVFSKEQRAFYAAHAPEGIALDDLSVLGPIHVLKLKFSPTDLERRLVAELWLYPDGSRVLELSTKCAPSDAFEVAGETRSYLEGHGVTTGGEQQTKTQKALEFFASRLAAGKP